MIRRATQATTRHSLEDVTDDREGRVDEVGATDPSSPSPRKVIPTGFATLRDLVLFCAGLSVIANEVFFQPNVEPASMAVGLAMTGLPLVFSADERRKS